MRRLTKGKVYLDMLICNKCYNEHHDQCMGKAGMYACGCECVKKRKIMEFLEEKIHLWIDSARYVKAKPGVYILYNRKLEPIFIGESENLQKQFGNYLDSGFQNYPCKQKTHSYQRIFTEEQTEKKKTLLEQFRKEYGRLPECNSE